MRFFVDQQQMPLYRRAVTAFLLLYIFQLLAAYFTLSAILRHQTAAHLSSVVNRVREDITYRDGLWDMSRYNADVQLPGTYPLYVLAADGFVLDRWRPVHNFLDTSDVKRLLSYDTAQTISTPAEQSWRVLSRPIVNSGQTVGVITVGYHDPSLLDPVSLDKQLASTLDYVASKLKVSGQNIDASAIDARDLTYSVTFQVVDQFNRVILKSNNNNSIDRLPDYVERSSVGRQLESLGLRKIIDTDGTPFLLYAAAIQDKNNQPIGLVVAGQSVKDYPTIINSFLIIEALISLLFILILIIYLRTLSNDMTGGGVKRAKPAESWRPKRLWFDATLSAIHIDDMEVAIPYATNQYALCKTIFSQPDKRWELEEILDELGDGVGTNWRKVYDAAHQVNRRTASYLHGIKLITIQGRTYQINPRLVDSVAVQKV